MQPWRVWVLQGAARDEIVRECVARYDRNEVSNREYNYYPVKWREPYLARRRACGWGLYGTLGIGREDKDKMHAQHARNYAFFDAPVGLIFSIDRDLERGSWLDYGMFLQAIMVGAREFGLETCPQAAWLSYHDMLQRRIGIPPDQTVVCGMALGYPDPDDKVNAYHAVADAGGGVRDVRGAVARVRRRQVLSDASLPAAQPRQPLLGLRRAELAGALVPFARLGEVGLHALHAGAGELAGVVGGGQQHGPARQAHLRGAQVELARHGDVALLGLALAARDQPLARLPVRGRQDRCARRGRRGRSHQLRRLGPGLLRRGGGGGGSGGGWTISTACACASCPPSSDTRLMLRSARPATPAGTIICRVASAWIGTDHAPGAVT